MTARAMDLVAGPLYPGMRHSDLAMDDIAWHPDCGWFLDDWETWSPKYRSSLLWGYRRWERSLEKSERRLERARASLAREAQSAALRRWVLRERQARLDEEQRYYEERVGLVAVQRWKMHRWGLLP